MRRLIGWAILAVALVATSAAFADEGDLRLRFGVTWVDPTGDLTVDLGVDDPDPVKAVQQLETVTIEATDAIGAEIGVEYFLNDKLGLDFGVGYADHDIDASAMGVTLEFGSITMMPVTFGANFHFLRDRELDLYVAPLVSWVMFGDVELTSDFAAELGQNEVAMKDDFGYGAKVGLDVPFGEKWLFTTGLRYMIVAAETDEEGENDEIDIDPWSVHLGLGVTF